MKTLAITLVLVSMCSSAWAVYGITISDLSVAPTPPNPIRVWGRVTSMSPVRISDGEAEIEVAGTAALLGDFLVLTGDWDGSVLTVTGSATAYAGPANTEMIYIPDGSFQMGNNGSEPYSFSDELPQHWVYLSGYWMRKHEVTRGEYAQFMAAGGYSEAAYWSADGWSWKVNENRTQPSYWNTVQDWGSGSFTQTDNHPVVGVTYYEAEAFCNWAGGHLPTEAQWEKAARWTGTYPNVYPWGNAWDEQKCNNWHDDLYPRYQTAPVGSYSSWPSPYGCQDMAGNVWEWCQDWYKSYPGSEYPFDYTGSYRVLRGGSWHVDDVNCRCAKRCINFPHSCDYGSGFRIAR